MNIVLYGKPGCQQCRLTALSLDKAGLNYTSVDLTTNDAALEYVQDLGYGQAPVVVVDDQHHWSGFNPTEIERLIRALQHAPGTQPTPNGIF
ncbi:glutaredoxin family protein [Pseudarthrobacter sp. HLT3-5]|uniref:glutaredoxin family protein n=1 Tax=Pseudarthrobacter cellobiosi TaxID=2953654 RepID=UPI00208F0A83|nr:glutaredoxin family protein [Pseudarthrobacter sp. HLT3-5]MCO4276044.1 glutaredoxin family protein [Pseudarthrobacter sp. HLT3-5]